MACSVSLAKVLDEFGAAMRSAGLSVPGELVADGKLHRFDVEGDKRHSKNGWYVLHADGLPAGEFGCWKRQIRETWCAKSDSELSEAERAQHRERIEAMRKVREAEQANTRNTARDKAAKLFKEASPRISADHPYLVAKQVRPYGLRQLQQQLVVPVRDSAGTLHGLQFIAADGGKKFLTGTHKSGHYHALGKPRGLIVIAEGYATGATIHEATGHAVAVAFDAGNLKAVAEAIRAKRPEVAIVLGADNDHATDGNPGLSKAREAAGAVNGLVVPPQFADGDKGTDWNDYAATHGIEAVREAFAKALQGATADGTKSISVQPQRKPEVAGNAAIDIGPRARCELRADGVYWIGVAYREGRLTELQPLFICSPLKIEAVTRDTRGGGFGRLVSFTDSDGVNKNTVIPARILGGSRSDELRGTLLDRGLPLMNCEALPQRKLTEYLMREVPEARARYVTRTGWQGAAFVLPSQTFGNEGGERFYLSESAAEGSSYSRAGSFEHWRQHVASPCGKHKRALFVMAAAFAGPLLDVLGAEGGGFHLVGGSSSGKTTALRLAASVWGNPDTYWKSWRSTDNGLEAIAEEFTDSLLALDEIGQVDPRIVGEVAYMLTNGRGKQRANKDSGARITKGWRVLLLSTGEVGTSTLMNEAGKRSRAGQEVRLVELPADAGRGFGLFDSAGVSDPRVTGSAREFVQTLIHGARNNYGHAGPLFVERLTRERETVAREGAEHLQQFVQDVCPRGADGQVLRVAARFALVCYAGELATQWTLTQWDFEAVRSACVNAFQAWLKKRGTHKAKEPVQMIEQVRRYIEQHGGAQFQDLSDHSHSQQQDYTKKDDPDYRAPLDTGADDIERRIINRAGYRKKVGGRTEYMVFPQLFKETLCEGFDPVEVCRALDGAGILIRTAGDGDRYTAKRRTPQSTKPLPFYVLDGNELLGSGE